MGVSGPVRIKHLYTQQYFSDTRDGRLHVEDISILQDGGVPYPIHVPAPMKSIADIQGAGW